MPNSTHTKPGTVFAYEKIKTEPSESCSIKYVHKYVKQKDCNEVTSGELGAGVMYS